MRHGRGRKGEYPREVKTQERIGSTVWGNTRRSAVRILTWLNPLKARSFDGPGRFPVAVSFYSSMPGRAGGSRDIVGYVGGANL
jgi:hypothetical protein